MGIGSNQAHADFWNDWVARSTAWENNPDNERRARHVLAAVDRHVPQGATVLEIGCGSGWMALELAKRHRVVATDLAHDWMERMRKARPEVDWRGGDFIAIDFAHRFDAVVCMETISHVPDQTAFADRIAALTAPGGLLVLTTQNPYVWSRTSWLEPTKPGQLRNWPSRERIKALFGPHFELERITTCAPSGDRGLPRVFNNRVSRALGARVLGKERWTLARERLGLGCSLVVVGHRPRQ